MSRGLICENCGAVTPVNRSGENRIDDSESVAWIEIRGGSMTLDACTRSCAIQLLADGTELALHVDASLEVVTDIARTIREDRDDMSGDS